MILDFSFFKVKKTALNILLLVYFYNFLFTLTDGERISSSTSIEVLLLDDFKLTINDRSYDVRPPKRGMGC